MTKKNDSFFWTSYSDLMTSLFFVMLVLFVLTVTLLHVRNKATEEQLRKIKEVEKAIQSIDTKYFEYRPEYKKHILKIEVRFNSGSSDMDNIDNFTKLELAYAGLSIQNFIRQNSKDNIQYLLIIEGQASRDLFTLNYELSYERALALKKFWESRSISFGSTCEVLISGSGDGRLSGTDFMRETLERNNQRFIINIVPKYGVINE